MSKVLCFTGLLCAFAILAAALSSRGLTPEARSDEEAYFGARTIRGTIMILNHPTMGKTPANGLPVTFQRTDCPKCFVTVSTDIEGHYSLALNEGRYRVIIREGTRLGDTHDILAPSQNRFLEVTNTGHVIQFDIEIFFPKPNN